MIVGRCIIALARWRRSGIWNLESGIWNMEYGVWSLEYGVWNMDKINDDIIIVTRQPRMSAKGNVRNEKE